MVKQEVTCYSNFFTHSAEGTLSTKLSFKYWREWSIGDHEYYICFLKWVYLLGPMSLRFVKVAGQSQMQGEWKQYCVQHDIIRVGNTVMLCKLSREIKVSYQWILHVWYLIVT